MDANSGSPSIGRRLQRNWPWFIVLLIASVAAWHALDFPDDIDVEFPNVARPTFSAHPPPAYRLAEPGDTIDRIAIYLSCLALVIAIGGAWRDRQHRRPRIAAVAISMAAFWYASNPGPTFDGWHGLSWATLLDQSASITIRVCLAMGAATLLGLVVWGLWPWKRELQRVRDQGHAKGLNSLIAVALILTLLRQIELPGVEPVGYWPRWSFVGGLVFFAAALVKLTPVRQEPRRRKFLLATVSVGSWFVLVGAGIWLSWYHRPLDRLRTVVPGRIYMSAMPTAKGLAIAQERHRFKTIINLFPEDSPYRSSRLPEELRFAEANGIRYYGSPTEVSKSNDFLDLTLKLARDPDAWPILVHCHACMDRTPAWVGIYRYVVEGWRLDDVFRFIEGHRGYRPKSSVTLLYNRVLPRLAPKRYFDDETAALLRHCAEGTLDPYYEQLEAEKNGLNPIRFADIDEEGRESSTIRQGRFLFRGAHAR